jgi:broad specificity phosphatase PhoE
MDDLTEVDLGRWDGAYLDDLRLSERDAFSAWSRDPETFPPPGGESILAVGRRVLAGLDRFLDGQAPGLTVAATHGDCLKGAVLVVLGAAGAAARRIQSPNAAMLTLRRSERGHWSLALPMPAPEPPSAD